MLRLSPTLDCGDDILLSSWNWRFRRVSAPTEHANGDRRWSEWCQILCKIHAV